MGVSHRAPETQLPPESSGGAEGRSEAILPGWCSFFGKVTKEEKVSLPGPEGVTKGLTSSSFFFSFVNPHIKLFSPLLFYRVEGREEGEKERDIDIRETHQLVASRPG